MTKPPAFPRKSRGLSLFFLWQSQKMFYRPQISWVGRRNQFIGKILTRKIVRFYGQAGKKTVY